MTRVGYSIYRIQLENRLFAAKNQKFWSQSKGTDTGLVLGTESFSNFAGVDIPVMLEPPLHWLKAPK